MPKAFLKIVEDNSEETYYELTPSVLSLDIHPMYASLEIKGVVDRINKQKTMGLTPVRILQSGNRVIVFWDDGSKTVVKRSDDTDDDIYGAFTAALAIKVYGSNSQVNRIIDRKHEHIDKVNGKPYVVSDYEKRKRVRKWMKEKQKREQKSNQ